APRTTRHALKVVLILAVVAAAGAYFAYDQYQVHRLARTVRQSFAAYRYEEAREPLQRWLRERPRSAEAPYYKAWLALTASEPAQIVEAINQASSLGFDPTLLGCLTAVCQARAHGFKEAEPTLRAAFDQKREPQVEVAAELARMYL